MEHNARQRSNTSADALDAGRNASARRRACKTRRHRLCVGTKTLKTRRIRRIACRLPRSRWSTVPGSTGRGLPGSSPAVSKEPTTGNCSSNTARPKCWCSTMAGSSRRPTTPRRVLACARSKTRPSAMLTRPTYPRRRLRGPPTPCARSRADIPATMPLHRRAPTPSSMARTAPSPRRPSRPRRGFWRPSMLMSAPRTRASVRSPSASAPPGRRWRWCAATARPIAMSARWSASMSRSWSATATGRKPAAPVMAAARAMNVSSSPISGSRPPTARCARR